MRSTLVRSASREGFGGGEVVAAVREIVGSGGQVAKAESPRGELLMSADLREWLFVCECDRGDCEERVLLTLLGYEELRSRQGLVLAPGHRASRTARARRAARELREEAQALQAQAAQ
jgi:hypothetical protein